MIIVILYFIIYNLSMFICIYIFFIQEFVTTEVLKLCGLKKEQNQKTDWQKMIKFGRKKRDRIDHILVSVFNLTFRMLVSKIAKPC